MVISALDQAWQDSIPDDPQQRHEEGGWIYLEISTNALSIVRASAGRPQAINLSHPPERLGSLVVGKFHTHPNPTEEGWEPGPSPQDERIDSRHGVPDLIRSDQGVFHSGPDSRRGGATGPPGYPN